MADSWPKKRRLIGTKIKRLDGPDKATGRAKYSYDINRPGMLHGMILRCPHAHAKIKSIDTTAAEKMPGFKAARRHRRGQGRAWSWRSTATSSTCRVAAAKKKGKADTREPKERAGHRPGDAGRHADQQEQGREAGRPEARRPGDGRERAGRRRHASCSTPATRSLAVAADTEEHASDAAAGDQGRVRGARPRRQRGGRPQEPGQEDDPRRRARATCQAGKDGDQGRRRRRASRTPTRSSRAPTACRSSPTSAWNRTAWSPSGTTTAG